MFIYVHMFQLLFISLSAVLQLSAVVVCLLYMILGTFDGLQVTQRDYNRTAKQYCLGTPTVVFQCTAGSIGISGGNLHVPFWDWLRRSSESPYYGPLEHGASHAPVKGRRRDGVVKSRWG